jgi:hypothetical protein
VRIPGAKFWIAACSLAAVLVAAVIETDRASPGPISSVHARLRNLKNGESCSSCHGGWFSGMTESCEKCHAPIGKQISEKRWLHGTLENTLAQSCGACHGEHHGETFQVVNAKSFTFAGVSGRDAFDHLKIGYELDGRHLEIRCADCHENADKEVLAEGEMRFLGLDRKCESCHVDPHQGRMRVDCVACHGQTNWQDLHSFGHEKQLPLVGGHGDVACRTCHAQGDAHALEILGESAKPPAARACADCHVSPHQVLFTRGAAELASLPPGAGCVECHLAEHTDFGDASTATTPAQHALTGFALEVSHADRVQGLLRSDLSVSARATPGVRARPAAVCQPMRTAASSRRDGSHGGVHGLPRQGRFEPHAFTVEKHAVTALPLTGKHVRRPATIHQKPSEKAPRTSRHAGGCELCHKDAHDGAFDATDTDLRTERRGTCASVTRRPPSRTSRPPASTTRWTGFAILGAHAEGESPPATARARARTKRDGSSARSPSGPSRGLRDVPRGRPPGRLRSTRLPAEVEGRTITRAATRRRPSAPCRAGSSTVVGPDSHSSRSTRPRLVPRATRRSTARSPELGRGPPPRDRRAPTATSIRTRASSRRRPRTTARCCHASDRKHFLAFEHDRDSRFKLGAQHRAVACEACHKAYPGADGFDVVRYRPLGRECIDCHGVDEDVLMRRKRRRSG